jgi:hypothetical protein
VGGYKRKELQILGGGLNLLPPVDKVPRQDMLVAQNWRVDRLGKLVSRFGYTQKWGSLVLCHSAAVHGGIEGDYYIGANQSTAYPTPSSVFWNFNFASPIATGFDGNRIGFAGMNGWMWIMNRGHQCRHQSALGAGTSQSWNLAAPANSATAVTAAGPGTVASVTYNYTLQGNPAYVHSLTINGTVYQFAENGYSAGQLPLVIASLAWKDPYATVTYSGAGSALTITPITPNTLVQVAGSDGNAAANLANGTVSALPNGTYQFYTTFESADQTLESNPSPASLPITVTNQSITLNSIPVSSDARVAMRNIYAVGGTLQKAYQVATVPDNVSTSWTFSFSDLGATNAGVIMPTTNDPPPAAAGLIGPYFSRLFAWSTASHPNRLFYTDPDLPQYWPGSADPATGNWVDVGEEGEAILWCTMHTNVLVIYKEKSIWELVGDPATGYLQLMAQGIGISGAFAVVNAGPVDYFVGPGGLYRFDVNSLQDICGNIRPLFQAGMAFNPTIAVSGAGSIKNGTTYNPNSYFPYAVALGYGMGKLYIGYAEQTTTSVSYPLLVFHEESGRWFQHRGYGTPWCGFIFDGQEMVGLTTGGYNLDDFSDAYTQDYTNLSIACIYQSHYEDAGLPDNQKKWLEVVVDYEFAGDTATVYVGYDNGNTALAALGTITGTSRKQTGFPLRMTSGADEDGVLAKTISVAIAAAASNLLIIHNVYVYYYEEARLAQAASTMPTDLSVGKVKQCKEIELDIDASGGIVNAAIYSDLPGNTLAVRQTPQVAANTGRALMRYPLTTTGTPPAYIQGYLWRLALTAVTGPFRLYGARMLMRVVGTFVEAYEATAGFVWDSMELTFESAITKIPRTFAIALAAIPIKRFREISLEIETFGGNVTLSFLTDLPGNAQAVRYTATINTGTAGRRVWRIPLPQLLAVPIAWSAGITYPAGTQAWSAGIPYQSLQNANVGNTPATSPTWWVPVPIEGRMCRLQLAGSAQFVLYDAAVELLPVGVYIEGYEAFGGAVWDSREQDLGTPAVKECRELELDIETSGGLTLNFYSDVNWVANVETPASIGPVVQCSQIISTTGRQKALIPLTLNAALDQFVEGRLLRLIVSGAAAFRLYGARVKVRAFGTYVDINEAQGGALWDSTELDLGTQTVKQVRELELDIWAYASVTVTVYTDLPGNAMESRAVYTPPATSGRTKVQIPLPQGSVPDNYLYGRLVRVTITSTAAFKLFGARIHARAIGVYAESYEATAGAVWDSMAQDLGSPADKYFDQVRFEIDSDGAAAVTVYTDLPGETMIQRAQAALTNGATSRHWATVPLGSGIGAPFSVEGRSIRTVVASAAGFRLYRAQVRSCRIGRYLAAVPASGTQDSFNTLEFDFQSGKVKTHKKLEIDVAADGSLNVEIYTEQSGQIQGIWETTVTTPNGRMTIVLPLPSGIRGRLLRVALTSAAAARVFRLRSWSRELNRADAQWDWDEYPLETSDAVPEWKDLPMPPTAPEFTYSDLPVDPTKPEWQWGALPVSPTPPAGDPAQWIWGKVLTVEETAPDWKYVDVDFEVTGQ